MKDPLFRRSARAAALGTVAVLSLAVSGCRPCESPPPQRWNVLVVMVDTLRADRLGTYGYRRNTDPFLRSFAERGLVFERASSQAGCTFPSVNSLFTSRSPQLFTAGVDEHGMAIPADVPTVAQLLGDAGYATAAVSASIVVRAKPSRVNRQGGFDAGFDVFDEDCLSRGAACVNDRAVALIDGLREPFFLYLHYLDPHAPYRPPRWHERRFATRRPSKRWVAQGEPGRLYRHFFGGEREPVPSEAELEHFRDLYDEEIRYFDARFEELVGELDRRGLLERTVVVLLSDHGEELAEHRQEWGHCRDLAHETVLHTPMVLWLPNGPTGRRRALVENLDVVPTLLDLLAFEETARLGLEGRSLCPVIETDEAVHAFVRSAQGTRRTWSDGRYKVVLDLESGGVGLFDLAEDPDELEGRADRRPDVVADALRSLRGWLGVPEGAEAAARARRLEERLETLGYLGDAEAPDPR